MKICIIHGSPRKKNTYTAVQIAKETLDQYEANDYTEFFLPKDMPQFCLGCFTCFYKSEHHCPHANYIQPIVEAMKAADGIILSTPVYVMGESAQIKAFLDHLGYLYLIHRPEPVMFKKTAMILSTTAGAGTNHATRTVARSLKYWGIPKIIQIGLVMQAENWKDINIKRKQKYEKKLSKQSKTFYNYMKNKDKRSMTPFARILFEVSKKLKKEGKTTEADKIYWDKQGWI